MTARRWKQAALVVAAGVLVALLGKAGALDFVQQLIASLQ